MARRYDVGTLQKILDSVDQAYALLDRDDCFVFCNKRYRALVGSVLDRLPLGIRFPALVRLLAESGLFPGAVGRVDAWLEQRLAQFRAGCRFEQTLRDGRVIEVRERAMPDGGLLLALVDITELKSTERALGDSEARFRDFADTASDWYWETGPDLRFTYMSDGIRKFGLDPATRLGRSRLELAVDAVDDPVKWQDHVAALQRREAFRDFQYKMKLSTESVHYVSVSGKPVFDEAGTFLGYRGSSLEITDRLLAAQSLKEAKNAAEAASLAKSTFLAHMSHELRTPLNAIIGFSTILSEQPWGPIELAKIRDYAKDIRDSGMHLLELINDILDLSRIEAGRMTVEETEVTMPCVVATVMRLMLSRAGAKQVALQARVDDRLPRLRADEMHVRQILLNLVSNAIKFTPSQGHAELRCWQTDRGAIALRVSDTGVGIADADIERLGTPFYQVEGIEERRHEGSGLGLSLTKKMVKLHGGELSIQSELGRGTTVTVTFPPERTVPADLC